MNQNAQISIKKLPNLGELSLPAYSTVDSAGMDLVAAIEGEVILKPFERKAIPTGIAIALPEGFEAQVRPRSGLALKNGITVANAPGTIDADYRGEVCAILINLSNEDFTISRGMRIAQMVIAQYTKASWNIVSELSDTARGTGGFGSTGMKQVANS
jgi:dUTP pyrophosphatase